MTNIIINADDFGYCEGVNQGIISAYKNGVVTSCSIMAGMPGFNQAVKLLNENKGLGCGVHMTLSCYKPVLDTHKTLVDESGYFFRRITKEKAMEFDLDEVYLELCSQIDKAIGAGVKISHLDSHHHIHTLEEFRPVIEKILEKYKLPIRGGFEYEISYDKVVPLIDSFYGDNINGDYFNNNIDYIKKFKVVDIMSHPAFVDAFLSKSTSYSIQRTLEHEILTSFELKQFFEDNNINLINYNNIGESEGI
ncbi:MULTISPECIES: carbohydrate deacetylase [Paraclostridium]|uniref:carbohydrate deacetylase n=1 Tax=Paraclostridium TaxID=1849822 RepID=UPI001475C3ED|nr:carbohydrate deacetylase [Paraclostridium sp. AKS81]MCU9810775.1 carbohydrate deacetylase [Paraclostridium sp. AKS81]